MLAYSTCFIFLWVLQAFSSLFRFIEYPLTIGESEVGRALYKSKNNCRVAKFKNAKRKQHEKKIHDKLLKKVKVHYFSLMLAA